MCPRSIWPLNGVTMNKNIAKVEDIKDRGSLDYIILILIPDVYNDKIKKNPGPYSKIPLHWVPEWFLRLWWFLGSAYQNDGTVILIICIIMILDIFDEKSSRQIYNVPLALANI